MRLRQLLLNFLLTIKITTLAENQLIIDYFAHKKAPSIFGFTCNSDTENLRLTKFFSGRGIRTLFTRLNIFFGVYRSVKTKYGKLGVVFDLRCYNNNVILQVLSEASSHKLYDELHYWLLIAPQFANLTGLINDESFDLSTDLAIAQQSSNSSYVLYDLYNPFKARGCKLNVTDLGSWNSSDGLKIFLTQNKYARRRDLRGLIWRIAYFSSKYRPRSVPLEQHLQDFDRTGTKDGLPKFGYSVVRHLAEMYNANIELREYGTWKKGDRSGPMSRALESNEIDMTGSLISVIPEKLRMLKFVYPAWPFRTCFIFRSPQSRNIKVTDILQPFQTCIWYLFIAMLAMFVLVLAVTFRLNREDLRIRYCNSFLIVIGCICQQGTCSQLDNMSTRIAFLSVMIFSLIMYNYYSASVVSARLKESIIKINDSLDSLAATKLSFASEPMIYFEFLMKDNTESGLFKRTKWDLVSETDRFMHPDKGMLLVRNGGFAYHTHPDVGYPYVNRFFNNREICELTEVNLGKPCYRSVAVAYNSSFTEISKRGFARMSEVGIRHRQLVRWKSRKPFCRNDILSASSVTIVEFAPQLIILLISIFLAIIICGVEVFIANRG